MIYSILNKLNTVKKFPYFICTPCPYAIGAASEQVDVAIHQANILGKKLLVIPPTIFQKILKYKIFNKYFFSELKINELTTKDQIFKLFFKALLNIQFLFNRIITLFLDKFTKIKLKEAFRFPCVGVAYDLGNKLDFDEIKLPKRKPHEVKLSNKANSQCLKQIQEMGIGKEDDYVCIHVRDNAYKNDSGKRNQSYNLFMRNSDINNYKESILYLLNKNYWVIRLNQFSEKQLEINHPKFIDYPFSKYKNLCLDLYLVKNCKFMISTQSGLQSLALLFGKPLLTTNSIRMFETKSTNEFSRVILKKPYWKTNKIFISLENYLKLKYKYHHVDHVNTEIDFEENSSSEILEATKEFVYNLENKKNKNISEKQFSFNQLMLSSLKNQYIDNTEKYEANLVNVRQVNNLIINLKESKEYYCNFFLEKYFKKNSQN